MPVDSGPEAEFQELLDEMAEPEEAEAPAAEEPEPEEAEEPSELEEDEPEAESELTADEQAAKDLLLAGNINGFAKKLGIDPKLLKVDPRQFAAMRRGLADAARLEREGKAKVEKGTQLHQQAEQVYGPIVAGFKAYKQGNPLNLRAAIELMCEDSFENVIASVGKAAKGLDPTQVEVIKLRKEMADRDAAQAAEKAKQTEAQHTAAEVSKLSSKLAGTPLAKIDGAAEEIYALVRNSYDGSGYTLTVKEAYAQVKSKHAKIAAAFGAKGGPSKPITKREILSPVRKDVKALNPADRKAQREADEAAEFRKVLAEAKEATKADERKNRRVSR
jgi:hypothetical protein